MNRKHLAVATRQLASMIAFAALFAVVTNLRPGPLLRAVANLARHTCACECHRAMPTPASPKPAVPPPAPPAPPVPAVKTPALGLVGPPAPPWVRLKMTQAKYEWLETAGVFGCYSPPESPEVERAQQEALERQRWTALEQQESVHQAVLRSHQASARRRGL